MKSLKSYNPATGDVVGEVPITSPDDIAGIVERSRAVQPAWEALGHDGRSRLLIEAAESFLTRADEFGRLITQEMGKPLREAIGEAKSLANVEHELEEIGEALAPEFFEDGRNRSTVYHDPLGVCAAITPWNFPMSMPAWMVLPALAAAAQSALRHCTCRRRWLYPDSGRHREQRFRWQLDDSGGDDGPGIAPDESRSSK